eukprot:994710-Prymnesium_polylepis.1
MHDRFPLPGQRFVPLAIKLEPLVHVLWLSQLDAVGRAARAHLPEVTWLHGVRVCVCACNGPTGRGTWTFTRRGRATDTA